MRCLLLALAALCAGCSSESSRSSAAAGTRQEASASAHAAAAAPTWAVASAPRLGAPLCGFCLAKHEATVVYRATEAVGTYNHAAMLDYDASLGGFLLTFNNAPRDEGEPGTRVLYSQSADGRVWTRSDGRNVLFPNMTTAGTPAALCGGPTIVLNGRRYASASPCGCYAQATQFCLWPFPFASSPTAAEDTNVLLLRRVGAGIPAALGPIFWASRKIPTGFEEASAREGVVPSSLMDAQTHADLAALANISHPPCASDSGSTKCECV